MKSPERTPQRTTEEIKKGLECCMDYQSCTDCGEPKCPYNDTKECVDTLLADAFAYIQQLEANWQQVSKALCGKENATLEEVLQAVDQVKQNKPGKKLICEITVDGEEVLRKALDKTEVDGKTLAEWLELAKGYEQLKAELATAEQERDAVVKGLTGGSLCSACKKYFKNGDENNGCKVDCFYTPHCFEWCGACSNTEVQVMAEVRPIDANALIKALLAYPIVSGGVLQDIREQPTLDYAPVRHGEWLTCGVFDDFIRCSCCGYSKPYGLPYPYYCPNCGAKMEVQPNDQP